MKEPIVIYGISAYAEMMRYNFDRYSPYQVVAFSVDRKYMTESSFCGLPIIAFEDITTSYPIDQFKLFVAIGYRIMRNRKVLYDKAKNQGYTLVNYISPKAVLHDDLIIGENNVIQSSVDIDIAVTIGNNNVFWTGSILGHNLEVGNHNYISGGGGLGGNCVVGDACFLGNGAIMVNNLNIADETYMVAGTVILRDTETASRYHGNPSKRIGSHVETGIEISDPN